MKTTSSSIQIIQRHQKLCRCLVKNLQNGLISQNFVKIQTSCCLKKVQIVYWDFPALSSKDPFWSNFFHTPITCSSHTGTRISTLSLSHVRIEREKKKNARKKTLPQKRSLRDFLVTSSTLAVIQQSPQNTQKRKKWDFSDKELIT